MLTLYYAPGACWMAAHIVLEESGEKYQPQKVDLANGEQRSETYLKINPQGRVPVLGLDSGEPLASAVASILPAELQEVTAKGSRISFAEPNFLDLRARSHTLDGVAEYSGGTATVTGGSEPARAVTVRVSGDFFRVIGAQPFLGRTFAPGPEKPGR